MFVGVRSAWAVGGMVVMESVLCDLWAGLQDTNQEVHGRQRGCSLWTAWGSDQTLQHSSVSWLVPSPLTWYTKTLSLSCCIKLDIFCLFKVAKVEHYHITVIAPEFPSTCLHSSCSSNWPNVSLRLNQAKVCFDIIKASEWEQTVQLW